MAFTRTPARIAEGDLEFDFGDATVYKPDLQGQRGAVQTAAVDFAVIAGERTLLVECKDLDNPRSRESERRRALVDMRNDTFVWHRAVPKLHRTVARLGRDGLLPPGEARYVLLIEAQGLHPVDRDKLRDQIAEIIRYAGPPGPAWSAKLAVEVLDVAQWNRRYPHIPVRRRSQA